MGQNFKRNFAKRVFQKTVPLKFQVLEEFDKNIFKYSHLKEHKILSNMRGRPALHDVSFQSYKHQKKTEKNVLSRFFRFFDKLCNFLSFLMLITVKRNIMESWATPHFAQNFLLFQVTIFLSNSSRTWNLSGTVFWKTLFTKFL